MEEAVNVLDLLCAEHPDANKVAELSRAVRALRVQTLDPAGPSIWDEFDGDPRKVSRGLREAVLRSGAADQAALAALYFQLLATEGCPVCSEACHAANFARHLLVADIDACKLCAGITVQAKC